MSIQLASNAEIEQLCCDKIYRMVSSKVNFLEHKKKNSLLEKGPNGNNRAIFDISWKSESTVNKQLNPTELKDVLLPYLSIFFNCAAFICFNIQQLN